MIAIDATGRNWGGLGHRIGRANPSSVWDAVHHACDFADRATVDRFVQYGPTGLHALVGEPETTNGRRPPMLYETYTLVQHLRHLYRIAILDLPVVELRGTWSPLQGASIPLLVARADTESVQHTLRLLTQLRGLADGMAERVILVMVVSRPRALRELRAARYQAVGAVPHVVVVPFDPILTRAEPIDVRQLAKATRRAFVDLATAVVAAAPQTSKEARETG
ncbi:MinD/ParA family ATP-binding protein [Plantactinospora sp. CA-290183]|uniref:MinD/ParA family ATP-binding protein n=1 Tax=Plantactinospora sp. CA-290183 TaxID=3240006 RepID=UPI003D8B91B4